MAAQGGESVWVAQAAQDLRGEHRLDAGRGLQNAVGVGFIQQHRDPFVQFGDLAREVARPPMTSTRVPEPAAGASDEHPQLPADEPRTTSDTTSLS